MAGFGFVVWPSVRSWEAEGGAVGSPSHVGLVGHDGRVGTGGRDDCVGRIGTTRHHCPAT